MTDYERDLYRVEIEQLRKIVATLTAQVAELTARLLDQGDD